MCVWKMKLATVIRNEEKKILLWCCAAWHKKMLDANITLTTELKEDDLCIRTKIQNKPLSLPYSVLGFLATKQVNLQDFAFGCTCFGVKFCSCHHFQDPQTLFTNNIDEHKHKVNDFQ